MKIILKIIFTVILILTLTALTIAAAFTIYKDAIFKKLETLIEQKLSLYTGCNVYFDSLKYVPLYSVSLNRVSVANPGESSSVIANINEVTVNLDVFSLIKNKQLKTTITIDGLSSGNSLLNATIRTISKKAPTFGRAFDASNLESVSIIEAAFSSGDAVFKNIFGLIAIDNMAVSNGKLHFMFNDMEYLINFSTLKHEKPSYNVSILSDNLKSDGIFIKDSSRIIIERFSGTFHALDFNLAGAFEDFFSAERMLTLKGTVKTDLGTLSSLPGGLGSFIHKHKLSGTLDADVNLTTKDLRLAGSNAAATIFSEEIFIDKTALKGLSMELSMENGRLSIPSMSARLYGGEVTSSLKSDFLEKDLPYIFSFSMNNVNFGAFMRDVSDNNINVYGTLDGSFSLKGYFLKDETAEGVGKLAIKNADLGPMPIFTPLLGNIFTYIQKAIPLAQEVTINEASADFIVENRKIKTKNILLSGNDIYSTAEGYVDFDGNLDFLVENHFKEPVSEEKTAWHTNLRNTIIRFGKFIGKAHLKGTITNPKWEFEQRDFLGDFIGKNVKGLLNTF